MSSLLRSVRPMTTKWASYYTTGRLTFDASLLELRAATESLNASVHRSRLLEITDARICRRATMYDTAGPVTAEMSAVEAVTKVIVRTSMQCGPYAIRRIAQTIIEVSFKPVRVARATACSM
jgi:hypothetical protein